MEALDQRDWQERWHVHICVECAAPFNCNGRVCEHEKYAVCAGCAGEREAVEMWQEAT